MKDSKLQKEYDQRLLLVVRQNYWNQMTLSQQGLWAGAWGQTISKNRITNKTIKKLEALILSFQPSIETQD